MYVKIINGKVDRYPYSATDLIRDNPSVSFPSYPLDDSLLAEWNVYPVTEIASPAFNAMTHRIIELSPEEVDGFWIQQWEVLTLTAEEATQAKAQLVEQFSNALTDHLDATAQTRRYDNRITCAVRAGYAGPFQAEGQAFAQWMDACNASAYVMLAEIEADTRPMFASVDEFIAALPTMSWPE